MKVTGQLLDLLAKRSMDGSPAVALLLTCMCSFPCLKVLSLMRWAFSTADCCVVLCALPVMS